MKIQHFCWDSLKGKIEIFTFSGCWKSGNVAIGKSKTSVHLKFSTRIATFVIFSQKKVFENSLNTFEDTALLLQHCKGKNWNFYIFWMLEKWYRCHGETRISAPLKFSTTINTFLVFQAKESFRKFVKYFWRYSISAGIV